MGLGTSWTVQNGGGQIFKPPGFHQYFAFFSLIRNGAMMGPPDLESTHKDASGDTHIIYFRQFQMCWNHPNNSPGSFDMDPKHHSNSPCTWAIHHITQWTWVRKHSPCPRAMVQISPGPGSHPQTIPGAFRMTRRYQSKITTLSRNPNTKQFLLRVGEIW